MNEDNKNRPLTVSQLNLMVREQLESTFPGIWVEGEISGFIHHRSGHMYFTLKDKHCELRCAMFRGANSRLTFQPKDGMSVLARGTVTVYEVQGSYQLNVGEMEPGGEGALRLAFERLKKKLAAEGLFDEARKRPLPRRPRGLGIVTSPDGAAIKDMLRVFASRRLGLPVKLFAAQVQGRGAAQEIVAGIEGLNRRKDIDLVIVGRGGGSLEDLWAFNEEEVARAIAASRLPVISAVGHEIDYTIADMVADLRCATPTAAAEAVCDLVETLRGELAELKGRLGRALAGVVRLAEARLMAARPARLRAAWQSYCRLRHEVLAQHGERLIRARDGLLKDKQHRLERLAARLKPLAPADVLRRGYSITTRIADGAVVTKAGQVQAGDGIRVRVDEGEFGAIVEDE